MRIFSRLNKFAVAVLGLAALALSLACVSLRSGDTSSGSASSVEDRDWKQEIAATPSQGKNQERPEVTASSDFWRTWGDGKAELSGYEVTTMRYGEPRQGNAVLIYVTEPMDSRTWVKDDRGEVPAEHRVNVVKLNHTLKFQTGVYPYSVMTSTFTPVDGDGRARFSPSKISMSSQEWCGHVYNQIFPKADRFFSMSHSYFGAEGDQHSAVETGGGALDEDALLIQLRELDGPFNGGRDWSGRLIPSLWSTRKAHVDLEPVAATITRADTELDGVAVTRFVITSAGQQRTVDVEKAGQRRVLGWSTSEGERARLLKTARLPYWQLNREGDQSYLSAIGLAPPAPSKRADRDTRQSYSGT